SSKSRSLSPTVSTSWTRGASSSRAPRTSSAPTPTSSSAFWVCSLEAPSRVSRDGGRRSIHGGAGGGRPLWVRALVHHLRQLSRGALRREAGGRDRGPWV